MSNENLIQFLETKLKSKVTNVVAPREGRIFAETTCAELIQVVQALKDWGMVNVGTITGLDSGDNFEAIYHMYDAHGLMLNLKVFTPRENPVIPSITPVYPSVFLYERELMDLLGIVVEGTPPNRRYPLPENWPQGEFPLRKDWKGFPTSKEVKQS
jgi:NADH:ubiquinone oxidoreductase subunit C